MKRLRTYSLISCLVMILILLIFGSSIAEDTKEEREARIKKCISCCENKKKVCLNIKAQLRLCEAVFQECTGTCNSEGASSSEWRDCWSAPADK